MVERTDYFRKKIKEIVDDLTLPAGPEADDCPEEFLVDEIMKLRGALWYALQMDDIDKVCYRIFTDQLNSLYEMATG